MDRMRRGLAELGDAVREGAAARTRQNPRGLPMDEMSRRARAEAQGYDLDQRFYHATNRDFDGFSLREAGSGGGTGGVKERAVYVTDAPAVADSYLGGGHLRIAGFPDEGAVPLPAGDDVGRYYAEGSRTLPVVVRGMEDMPEWDMDRAMFSPQDTERALRGARADRAPGVIMDNYRDPGGVVAGPLGNGSQASRIVAVRDPRNLRSPHATFDPARAREADLLAGMGGAGLAAGAAFEGLVGGGEAEGNHYEGGGLVGRAARLRQLRRDTIDPAMEDFGRMLRDRPIGISASGRSADGILMDGRFRSQFETGRSDGSYDPAYRAELEQRLFGIPPDIAPEERPIYGALRSARPEERVSQRRAPYEEVGPWETGTYHYGDHTFLLRPEVKPRSTYTMDDSFSLDGNSMRDPRVARAFRFDEPAPRGGLLAESLRTLNSRGDPISREGALRTGESFGAIQEEITPGNRLSLNHLRSPYIETQTRGPVTLDDVSALIVPHSVTQDRYHMARDLGLDVYNREQVVRDHDLQRRLGLRVGAGLTAGGGAAGGLGGSDDEEGNRYAGGGLAEAEGFGEGGLLRRGLEALGRPANDLRPATPMPPEARAQAHWFSEFGGDELDAHHRRMEWGGAPADAEAAEMERRRRATAEMREAEWRRDPDASGGPGAPPLEGLLRLRALGSEAEFRRLLREGDASADAARESGALRGARLMGRDEWRDLKAAVRGGEIENPYRYAQGGLAEAALSASGAPGPADEIATTQGASARGLQQAQQMWAAAGSLMGRGGIGMGGGVDQSSAAHWGMVS